MKSMEQEKYQAESIKVLEGLSAVRKRPAMYIGNIGIEGLHHLVYEVVDNSIDESMAGFCDFIHVIINENNSITVEDNGRGIPVDIHPTEGISALELVLTKLHAGGKFDNQTYKVSGGLHGVGISVVNALSKYLEVEVYRDGKIYNQKYEKGIPITPVTIIGETKKRGTKVTFIPDEEIFTETTEFQYDILQARMRELAYLNNNITIKLEDKRSEKTAEFHFKGGIVSFVEHLNKNKELIFDKPIYISAEKDNVAIEIAFQYNDGYSEKLLSYVNNIRTKEDGTHVTGFRQALTKCINKYLADDNISKKLKEKIEGDDVREGLTCIVSVKVPNPQFEGQTKSKLGNSEVRSIVSSVVYENLSLFFEENPSIVKKMLEKIVEAARAREAARKAKELSRKSSSGLDITLAGKLADCQEKNPEHREIFIVEGDSAGGSAKQGRDRKFQAILPLRGKIMNVEKARFNKILSSEEIRNLISSIGTGIGTGIGSDDFDINKLKYHKIIIMTDADVDGAHIRTLLLTFFYRHMYELIEKGYLYIAQPPLYRVVYGKNKEIFLKDDSEFNKFLFNRIINEMSVIINGKTITGKNLYDFLLTITDYLSNFDELIRIGLWKDLMKDFLNLDFDSYEKLSDPTFMESLFIRLSEKGYKITNKSQSTNGDYSFVITSGSISFLSIKIDSDLWKMPEIKKTIKLYKLLKQTLTSEIILKYKDNQETFNDIELFLTAIKEYAQKGLTKQRYKGLGEMNPEQLWKTTMDPQNRTLLQVSVLDADEAENLFTTLMGEKIEPRKDFIYNHALEVKELDI